MPTTRKKVIKTVYKDEDDSEAERAAGDFSDSGSDAQISEYSSSDEEAGSDDSLEEFDKKSKKITPKAKTVRKPKFATEFISKINKQISVSNENETVVAPALFSVKDLTEADKLLPTFLNLSESDSSEDESPKPQKKPQNNPLISNETNYSVSDDEEHTEYKDVWSNIMPDNSEEVAKKTFMELEQHKSMIEEAKASILNYASKPKSDGESDVKDLLALGEDVPALPSPAPVNKVRKTKKRKDSDSEVEDWEEVKEARTIPQQGLQLVVDFPDATYRKTKKLDLEMMMKRRINRVKKEYQVYMHKVHVLCWLGHGNYVSRVLNDQEVLAAALSLVPSKECYPGERVDMKYVEQITTWYKDKLILKQDKNEDKFRPKAPPLKEILLGQIKSRVVTTRKYLIYIFISMLRALGLQCRVMLNFVALPIKPPSTELCSLSTKPKDSKINCSKEKEGNCKEKHKNKISTKSKTKTKISQVDGSYDFSSCDDDFGNIVQVDGNDDMLAATSRNTRATRAKKKFTTSTDGNDDILAVKSRNTKATGAKKFFTTSRDGNEDTLAAKSGNSRITRASKNLTTSSSRDGNDDTLAAKSGHSRTSRAKENFTTSRDGNDDTLAAKSGNTRITRAKKILTTSSENQDISPPKRAKKNLSPKSTKNVAKTIETSNNVNTTLPQKRKRDTRSNQGSETELSTQSKEFGNIDESQKQLPELNPRRRRKLLDNDKTLTKDMGESTAKPDNHIEGTPKPTQPTSLRRTRNICKNTSNADDQMGIKPEKNNTKQKSQVTKPKIIITNTDQANTSSKYSDNTQPAKSVKRLSLSRNRSHTATPPATSQTVVIDKHSVTKTKTRTKSAPGSIAFHNKHFNSDMENSENKKKPKSTYSSRKDEASEDKQRVSHKDLRAKTKAISKNDVTSDLVHIIKKRVKEAKEESKRGILKDKTKHESDGDSDYLPEESAKHRNSDSDEDFKPTKLSPKPGPSSRRKIDRRVLSSDDATPKNKCDVWCEVFVEELEQWISVDVIKGRVHCTKEMYGSATQPVCYVVGWDNNNYLKEVTRRYVPHWNTVTRKQRAEPAWWDDSVRPWLGPKTARDKEEDEELNRMQLEAPLPKSIAEYKNHPLYALKRHLLKFEAFYPPDAATLGFVRNEPVYARECVHVCRSRDAWLKEAKVVRLGEQPYKLVKPRPRWDKINCKIYTPDEPLEIFGPWQVQDYEPPTAENGIVPRNAYGNVELFKDCMLPKGTVHIKLPGLNRVAKKLNIDCAPAMRGFDPNCGWAHPIYDGFVVCKEFEEIIQEAWAQDQEEQERKEREKIEARVYGNWKRLIKGLLIKQRLKNKYGFKDPTTSQDKKNTGPRLFAKKKS